MTPSSKAKVLTDAELEDFRALATDNPLGEFSSWDINEFLATIDALKAELAQKNDKVKSLCDIVEKIEAELALKDKVVEAARELDKAAPPFIYGHRRALSEALNDLDKVMAR